MSSGVTRTRFGSVMGTGANIDIDTIGFTPRKVELFNVDGLAKGEWTESMPDGHVLKQITAGTMSYPTTLGVTPRAKGFRIGTDADLNVDGEEIHYVAHQ